MRSVRLFLLAILPLGLAACEDELLMSSDGKPEEPIQLMEGIQAYLQIDNYAAQPGQVVHISVKVQVGAKSDSKVGSYTGRLQFDPEALSYTDEVEIDDGLRVANPNGSGEGELRFAGAAARGFSNLTLYEAVFKVKDADYVDGLVLQMEELSEALSLSNLQPNLQVTPQIFYRDLPD